MLGLRFNQAAYTVDENVDSGVVTINLELVSMVPDHGNPTEADIWVTLEATNGLAGELNIIHFTQRHAHKLIEGGRGRWERGGRERSGRREGGRGGRYHNYVAIIIVTKFCM